MGGGSYKGGASYYHSVSDNIKATSNTYKYHNGYFGEKSKQSNNKIRLIISDNPTKTATDFYKKLTYGGIEKKLPNGKGKYVKMQDGTIISWRPKSSSDKSPAIDINITKSDDAGGIKQQKIHFVKGE